MASSNQEVESEESGDLVVRGSEVSGPSETPVKARTPVSSRRRRPVQITQFGIIGVVVLVAVVADLVSPGFLSVTNISLILSQNAAEGIVAVGMTFVIITGGFDLSVGSTYALSSVVFAELSVNHHAVWIAVLGALAVGVLIGCGNAIIIVLLRVNPFIATLSSSFIILGIAILYTNAQPIMGAGAGFDTLGTGSLFGIPNIIVILVAVFIFGGFVLRFTIYGRETYAIGGNPEASRLSGIRVGWVRGRAYIMVGLLAALAGVLIASQMGSAEASIGGTVALDTIAMVVLGGTLLSGGEGAMWRTGAGFLILSLVTELFNRLAINSSWVEIVKGAILIVAIAAGQLAGRHPLKIFHRPSR